VNGTFINGVAHGGVKKGVLLVLAKKVLRESAGRMREVGGGQPGSRIRGGNSANGAKASDR